MLRIVLINIFVFVKKIGHILDGKISLLFYLKDEN